MSGFITLHFIMITILGCAGQEGNLSCQFYGFLLIISVPPLFSAYHWLVITIFAILSFTQFDVPQSSLTISTPQCLLHPYPHYAIP